MVQLHRPSVLLLGFAHVALGLLCVALVAVRADAFPDGFFIPLVLGGALAVAVDNVGLCNFSFHGVVVVAVRRRECNDFGAASLFKVVLVIGNFAFQVVGFGL